MERRDFLRTGSAAALGLSGFHRYAEAFAETCLRVGVIGTGWYGKCNLFRLLQVAPVEVVSLCDVDSAMLRDAAEQVAARQASKKTPRTYGDYRTMLAERDLDLVIVATPTTGTRSPRSRRSRPGPTCTSRSRSAWTWWRGRPWSRPPGAAAGSCRWARSGAARPT
jgi:hypothetical protein